jgi:hypothetical protein
MEEETENNGLSLTINNGIPCFIMSDGSVKTSTSPQLFETGNGILGYADNFMQKLQDLYPSVEEMREHAASKIEELGLLDTPESDSYSIWLLVAMTID